MMKINRLFMKFGCAGLCVLAGLIAANSSVAQQFEGSSSSLRQIVCGTYSCTIGNPGNGGHQRVCWEIKKKSKNKCEYQCQGAQEERPEDCKKTEKYQCRKVTESTRNCAPMQGDAITREADYTKGELKSYPDCKEFKVAERTCRCDNKVCNKGETCSRETYGTAGSGGYYNVCKDESTPVCNDGKEVKTRCRCGGKTREFEICEVGGKCSVYDNGLHRCTYGQDPDAPRSSNGLPYCQIDTPNTQECQCGQSVTACGVGYVCTVENMNVSTGGASARTTSHTCIDPKNPPDKCRMGNCVSTSYDGLGCATYAEYVEKYTSGCWSCLVMEKITSSFLRVASKGLKVCQEAGHILLWLGFAIWLAVWGLKNVSSFTEIKGSNILNDLLKMGAKIVIAYCCITAGPAAIREFVVTPIMGLGATIAQNFWYRSEDAKNSGISEKYMKGIEDEHFEWVTEEDQEAMHEFVNREENVGETPIPQSSGLTQEQQEENEAIAAENDAVFDKSAIPNLLIPGVRGGCITSGAGCRPASAGGSLCHQGVDVGCVGNAKTNCVPYIAAGPGRVFYQDIGGYGHMAKVEHGTVGKYDWKTTYNHMNGALTANLKRKYNLYNGKQVKQGEPIGCVGSSGMKDGKIIDDAYAQHIHFEVYASGKPVDPLALPAGQIVFIDDICGPFLSGNSRPRKTKNCNGSNRITSSATEAFLKCKSKVESWSCNNQIPAGGWPAAGEAVVALNTGDLSGGADYGSLNVQIPDIKYTGPTDIMPKSVMNSILGAVKAITYNTAQYQILGNIAWCYSGVKNERGGAFKIKLVFTEFYITNFSMLLCGAIIWFLGFMLTCVVAFYLLDMSFKVGFAVMALPIVMGLWPFKVTQSKLAEVISIIVKASCDFAFLALTTYFGLNLVASVYGDGGIEKLFEEYDSVIENTAGGDTNLIVEKLKDAFYLFSSTFLMLLFAIVYAYKLVSQTAKDLVEKFFPDSAFGSVSPMHKGLTGAASIVNNLNKKYGVGLAADIAANKAGQGIRKLGGKVTGAMAAAPKAGLNAVRRGINKLKGGGKK